MKSFLIIALCLSALSGFSQKKKEEPAASKTITLVLSEEQMISAYYLFQTGKNYIFDSEMPAKNAKEAYKLADSLSKVFTDQAAVWHPQPATNPEHKTDSTGKK